jgi:hypothetical protein
MADTLTKRQRDLRKELEKIAEIVRIDYWNILEREKAARTPVLEVMRRELIRGEIVGQYTLIDDKNYAKHFRATRVAGTTNYKRKCEPDFPTVAMLNPAPAVLSVQPSWKPWDWLPSSSR